jgi:hypothetical protein
MNNYLGKTRKCQFCKEVYELDYYDNNPIHNSYCNGNCQYYGEVLPDYIKEATGEQKIELSNELDKAKAKLTTQ